MVKNDVITLSSRKMFDNHISIELGTNIDNETEKNYYIIKKDGTKEKFNIEKVVKAVNKSAERVMINFTDKELANFCRSVLNKAHDLMRSRKTDHLEVIDMHRIVESSLDLLNSKVALSYKDYRNYKTSFVSMLDAVFKDAQKIMYLGDNENSNTDSALVSTKRSLIYNVLNKELYKKFFLTTDELQAVKDGYFYIHDMSARRDTVNCCLCDIKNILEGGFELGNQWYTEPKTLDVAFDVMGDIILSAASQQYGGFTIPQVDEVLKKYAEMSYNKYFTEIYDTLTKDYEYYCELNENIKTSKLKIKERNFELAHEGAMKKVERDFEQGFQGWEYKFNTVASSRGDYPFITMTFGLGTSELERLSNKVMLRVRAGGQGKPGHKRAVLFPKLVFLYDSKIHGEMGICRDVYEAGITCSSKALYPDWLSLEPGSYVGDIYQKYGRVISPMGKWKYAAHVKHLELCA